MKRSLIIISVVLILAPVNVFAQVREINFLGKKWHLHGVDARFGFKNMAMNNPQALLQEESNQITELIAKYDKTKIADNVITSSGQNYLSYNISAGLIFKPFSKSEKRHLQSPEVVQQIGIFKQYFEPSWDTATMSSSFRPFGAKSISSHLTYNPSLTMSTPTFGGLFKAYAGGDVRFDFPLFQEFSLTNNSAQVIYEQPSDAISKENAYNQTSFQLLSKRAGIGYTIGIKMYLSCNTNFHIELKDTYLLEKYQFTENTCKYRNLQVQAGLRYKFSKPESPASKSNDLAKSAFW